MSVGTLAPLLPEGVTLTPFAPVAYYDQHMDCIRVLLRDQSVTEERVDDFMTLYEANHRGPFDREHCGFCIKGVAHLFNEIGLGMGDVMTLTDLIDAIAKNRPGTLMSKILSDFPQEEADIKLEWEAIPQAA